jgi:hypothetical protein
MPIGDTGLCVFHTPEFEDARAEGRSLGGRRYAAAKIEGLPGTVTKPKDVLDAVNALIVETSKRDCSPATIASLVRLYDLALSVMVGQEAEERIAELERIAEERGNA